MSSRCARRIVLASMFAVAATAAGAQPPLASVNFEAIRATKWTTVSSEACRPPPRAVADVDAVSSASALHDLLATVEHHAELWVMSRPPQPDAAECALLQMDAWGRFGGLARVADRQAESLRTATLAGLALSWLEIRDAPYLDPWARSRVLIWLRRVAAVVRLSHEQGSGSAPPDTREADIAWSGLALAASGVALDDRGFFDWGIRQARTLIGSANTDGTLPHELGAGQLALHAHLTVLQPLSVLNELAYANGIDLEADGRLARMVATGFAGARHEALFARLTGRRQSGVDAAESANPLANAAGILVWLGRHPDAFIYSALVPLLPLREPGLGGDVGLLYGP
jgi:hypothetical protein